MKECKIVSIDIKSGAIKAIAEVDKHFVNECPLNNESITDYINKGYKVKRLIPLTSPCFFKEHNPTSAAQELALFYRWCR